MLGLTWVNVDSPDFPFNILSSFVYKRMRRRIKWHANIYSGEELKDVSVRFSSSARRVMCSTTIMQCSQIKDAEHIKIG